MIATIKSHIDTNYEIKDLQHSLRSSNLELELERSKHSVEAVVKDEEVRKLRVAQCLLQDDINDLHEQLEEEQARSDDLENALDEALEHLDQLKAKDEAAQSYNRTQSREVANLKAELKAMENVSSDSNRTLSEKLALSRELASLRPEVEHLRAQVESNQGLLTEKLALQRQLTTLQVELENERRTSARTIAKQGKRSEQDMDVRGELDEVRAELSKENKDRVKAEKMVQKAQSELESQQEITKRLQAKVDRLVKKDTDKSSKRDEASEAALEELREELKQEKAARKKAEKSNKSSRDEYAEMEQLRQELEQEKQDRQKAEKAVKKESQQDNIQTEIIKQQLEEERRERKKQEKEYAKTLYELQSRNTVLDDKCAAFREKLRSTKEKLKDKEAELARADRVQTAPPLKTVAQSATESAVQNSRKRMAATVDPETNLGTPGDGFPAKKTKRGTSVSMGDTSTFSLTPFLNRAANVAIASPIVEEEGETMQAEPTPTAPHRQVIKTAAQLKSKPLVPATSNKASAKPRKKAATPALEMVTEESAKVSNNIVKDKSETIPITVPLKDADDGQPTKFKSHVPKAKPRKSLMSFATFVEEPVAEKKKKRKLGTGAGKTLFDAEDAEDPVPLKPVGFGKGVFATRALGKSMLGKTGQQRPISGGFGMMSEEAYTFSPLKRDRRGGASILK